MSNSSCLITANGDLAGLGTRVAFYVQALLPLVSVTVIPYPSISSVDVAVLRQYCERGSGSLVVYSSTSAALLVAAFVGLFKGDLSPHHALVVLNLTWIILISSCGRAVALFYIQKHGIPGSFVQRLHKAVQERFQSRNPQREKESAPVTPPGDTESILKLSRHTSVLGWHLLVTGVLGWLLFSDIEGFAGPAGCPRDTVLWMFASPVHITNPTPRLFWKIIYMTALLSPISLPVLCFLFCFSFKITFALFDELAASVSRALRFLRVQAPDDDDNNPTPSSALPIRAFITFCVVIVILLIVSTEETIKYNVVEPGGEVWGFGQTLALVLAAFALHESVENLQMSLKLRGASRRRILP